MVRVSFRVYKTSPEFLPLLEAPLEVTFGIAIRAVKICS